MSTSEDPNPSDPKLVERLVHDLLDSDLKGNALAELRKEIIVVYPALSPPTLSLLASNRVCNALALLQCVASHPETRSHFLKARIPLYLCAFLETNSKIRPFEYLRLTSLGVIGALVKAGDTEVITFLLQYEFVPLCLQAMTIGSEVSKTVATFVIEKIVMDEAGLGYICATVDEFFSVVTALGSMVTSLDDKPSPRLLKHIIHCYLKITENPRGLAALQTCLPTTLKDGTFNKFIKEDATMRQSLQQLLGKVTSGKIGGQAPSVLGHMPIV
uniref:Cell differentiation protein rcd1 n=1 Tax=Leersia perrieri TaxID=77586 RepID=A0A0D9VF55_9ORYZ